MKWHLCSVPTRTNLILHKASQRVVADLRTRRFRLTVTQGARTCTQHRILLHLTDVSLLLFSPLDKRGEVSSPHKLPYVCHRFRRRTESLFRSGSCSEASLEKRNGMAAFHLHVLTWRVFPFSLQHVPTVDVRLRTGTSFGVTGVP